MNTSDTVYAELQEYIEPHSLTPNTPDVFQDQQPVVYWMTREHRVHDNRGLWLAQRWAQQAQAPLYIVTAFRKDLSKASMLNRTFSFLLDGLQEVETTARQLDIPMVYLQSDPVAELTQFITKQNVGTVVTDLFPLEPYRQWQADLRAKIEAPVVVVDSHNTLPVWKVSDKQEYAARTIRPKIWKQFDTRVGELPKLQKHKYPPEKMPDSVDWQQIFSSTKTQFGYPEIKKAAGATAAQKALHEFSSNRLPGYAENRNDPANEGTSGLSAYFHFGHLSCTQVVAAVQDADAPQADKDAFLEEFVVRKELSDNFCYYQKGTNYRTLHAIPDWAKKTLDKHASDPREHWYSYDQLLNAQTHDQAWNACQLQMTQTGYMHGYMRMYWAKKILEWTKTPQQALEYCITMNDLFELDGRDPNGYVGILWAIGGVHDRPWQERDIFGTVRYMNFNGLKRKFEIEKYIDRWVASDKQLSLDSEEK